MPLSLPYRTKLRPYGPISTGHYHGHSDRPQVQVPSGRSGSDRDPMIMGRNRHGRSERLVTTEAYWARLSSTTQLALLSGAGNSGTIGEALNC
eukprot:103418-Hanusia_phi.AAC.1